MGCCLPGSGGQPHCDHPRDRNANAHGHSPGQRRPQGDSRGSAGPWGGGVPGPFATWWSSVAASLRQRLPRLPALMPFQISRFFASSTGCIVSEGVMLSNGTGAKATRRSCHEALILSWRIQILCRRSCQAQTLRPRGSPPGTHPLVRTARWPTGRVAGARGESVRSFGRRDRPRRTRDVRTCEAEPDPKTALGLCADMIASCSRLP